MFAIPYKVFPPNDKVFQIVKGIFNKHCKHIAQVNI